MVRGAGYLTVLHKDWPQNLGFNLRFKLRDSNSVRQETVVQEMATQKMMEDGRRRWSRKRTIDICEVEI